MYSTAFELVSETELLDLTSDKIVTFVPDVVEGGIVALSVNLIIRNCTVDVLVNHVRGNNKIRLFFWI